MTTHTPTPWKVSGNEIVVLDGSVAEVNSPENAALIVRAVNAHEELLAIVKAIGESFDAGANQVYAEALAPHTDDETLKTWIKKAIAKAEGK